MPSAQHLYKITAATLLALAGFATSQARAGYITTDLVTNTPVAGAVTDPNLVNPWGVAYGPTGPFWVSDNNTNLTTLYTGTGAIVPLVVGVSNPTGQVFNSDTSGFNVGTTGKAASFIFAGDNNGGTSPATISAWNSGKTATVEITSPGESYTGITQGSVGGQTYLYAANSGGSGGIDVFNSNFQKVSLTGSFQDPNLPAGYVPFNVRVLNGNLFVTYSDTMGSGGVVAEYNLSGNFIKQVAAGGTLNQPWGIDIAPSAFGAFSNDLLVGNFGSGTIDAFNPTSDAFLGQLTNQTSGQPLVEAGLWSLINGNGAKAGSLDTVYFTAGGPAETSGVLGGISVPEPSTLALLVSGLLGLILVRRRSTSNQT